MIEGIQNGIQAEKMEQAIRAYTDRITDLRSGAALAEISYNHFMHEIEKRNIVVLEDDRFLESVLFLAETFESPQLQRAVESLQSDKASHP